MKNQTVRMAARQHATIERAKLRLDMTSTSEVVRRALDLLGACLDVADGAELVLRNPESGKERHILLW